MTVIAGTTSSHNQSGQREDLWDIITNSSPTDTPFQNNIDKTTAKAKLHEWLTDSLAAAAANNQIEGDDASYTTAVTVTTLSASTQILRKTILVSGTLEAVDKAGRKSELKYQLMKAGKELKRDLETAMCGSQTGSAGGVATGRSMTGAEAWIPSSENGGNGVSMADLSLNSTSSFASGHVVTEPTAASGKPITSTALLTALQKAWLDGGDIDTIMTGPTTRRTIRTFGNLATNQIQLNKAGEAAKLIDTVEIYVSDYGKHKLVLNRFSRDATALCLDMSTWALATLRPMQTEDLAKTGDANKKMILMEATLVCRNPDSNAKVSACSA